MTTVLLFLSVFLMIVAVVITGMVVVGVIRIENNYTFIHIASVSDAFIVPLMMVAIALLLFALEYSFEGLKVLLLMFITYMMNLINSYIVIKVIYLYRKVPMDSYRGK